MISGEDKNAKFPIANGVAIEIIAHLDRVKTGEHR